MERPQPISVKPLQIVPWIALGAFVLLWRHKPAVPSLSDPRELSPEGFDKAEPGRGRAAPKVRQIPHRGWRDIAWRVYQEIGKDRLPIVAGGVTFYTLLALFPALGAFVALYGLIADVHAVETQIAQLSLILPPDVVALLADQMRRLAAAHDSTLSLTFIFSLALAIWSANAGVNALFDGMNIAYGEAEKRNWFKRRGLTLAFTLGLVAVVTALSILLIAVPLRLSDYGLAPSEVWWIPFSWIAALAMIVASFAALYRFGPSRAQARWAWVWPGAFAAAAGWIAGSVAFSIYVSRFANYADAYGPLGTVIAFMVWIWVSAMAILLGAELNAEIEHQTAVDTTTGPEAPMGARGAAMADTVGLAFKGFHFFKRWRTPSAPWRTLRKTAP